MVRGKYIICTVVFVYLGCPVVRVGIRRLCRNNSQRLPITLKIAACVFESQPICSVGVINSVFRITAIVFFIPYSGAVGYLWLLMASNTLSFALCFGRLKKLTAFRFSKRILVSLLSAALSLGAAWAVSRFGLEIGDMALCVLLGTVTGGTYLLCLKKGRVL